MQLNEKLAAVQAELKAPKNQRNTFGGYNYRSCEDILEAVKLLLAAHKATITLSDELMQVGERYYVKATATFADLESEAVITNTAYAREADTKKGMDESQITGTASSYARKYCLNGLLLIDDCKDADTDEYAKTTGKEKPAAKAQNINNSKGINIAAIKEELAIIDDAGSVREYYKGYVGRANLTDKQKDLLSNLCQQRVKKIEEAK